MGEKETETRKLILNINSLERRLGMEKYKFEKLGRKNEQNKNYIQDQKRQITGLKNQMEEKQNEYTKEVLENFNHKDELFKKGREIRDLQELTKNLLEQSVPMTQTDVNVYNSVKDAYRLMTEKIEKMREENKSGDEIVQEINNGIEYLKIQAEDFGKKANDTDNPFKKANYEMYKERTEFEIDRFKMDFLDKRPESNGTIKAIEEETDNNPEVAFEKFKRFAKENFVGISGVLIGIAGIVATIAVAIRNSAKRAGNTAQKAGKAGCRRISWKLGEKLGKIISWAGDNILVSIGIIITVFWLLVRKQ